MSLNYPKLSNLRPMQVDDIADQHDDLDTDSLFGSPPPSPRRTGRSPSPLALPSGQDTVQNVGTLALPGSHLCSELSELPPAPMPVPLPSLPQLRNGPRQFSQPVITTAQSCRQPRSATMPPRTATPLARPVPTARKPKRASRRSTPASEARPTPPPITLPSPTEPPPANFLRNQQALLGVAGLVGGVNPATLSVQRHTRGESPSNPIVVEDEHDTPRIGRRPVQNPALVGAQLPVPSTQEILATLLKQKNLYPVVDALLRLVATSSGTPVPVPPLVPPLLPSTSSTSTAGSSQVPAYPPTYQYSYYPYQYPYPYYYSYPYPYATPYYHAASFASSSPDGGPQAKKRKLSAVPAGAADWDVPYPFAAGQGPPGYHSNWGRQRQQQLLEDLVGLIQSAAKKAAAKKAVGVPNEEGGVKPSIGSVEYYRERVLRHYRPQPGGEEARGLQVTSTPVLTAMPAAPSQQVTPSVTTEPQLRSQASPEEPATSMDSMEPTTVPEPIISDPSTQPATEAPRAMEGSMSSTQQSPTFPESPAPDAPASQDLTTSNIDELLALFNDISASELDALFASADMSGTSTPTGSSSTMFDFPADRDESTAGSDDSNHSKNTVPSTSDASSGSILEPSIDPSIFALDPSLLAIDPALLAISFPAATSSTTASGDSQLVPGSSQSASGMGTGAPPTPTLANSPVSLADMDPPTPQWAFSFPEPEIASVDEGGCGGDEHESSTRHGTSGSDGSAMGTSGGCFTLGGDLRRYVLTKGNRADRDSGNGPEGKKDKGKGKATAEELGFALDMDVSLDADMDAFAANSMADAATMGAGVGESRSSTPRAAPWTDGDELATPRPSAPVLVPPSVPPAPSAPLPFALPAYLLPHPPVPPGLSNNSLLMGLTNPSHPSRLPAFPSTLTKPSATPSLQVRNKDDIVRRARAMRTQLKEEIERAKVELWETTMEGGCLAVVAKERDKLALTGGSG